MTEILQDLSPAWLRAAIEANMYALLPLFGRLAGAQYVETPALRRSITSVPFGLFNSLMAAKLEDDSADQVIQEIVADAQRRQMPILWWTGPLTEPTDLEKRLVGFGFRAADDHAPGMAVELAKLNEDLPRLEGLSIRLCEGRQAKKEWTRAMAEANEIPAEAAFLTEAWEELVARAEGDVMLPYLAEWNGHPVAVSLMLMGAGVAGIYGVATVPEARRRGIGAWVTLAPLLKAREMGYRVGVLASSEMGLGVYRKLGFVEYCKISSYRWRP